MKFDWVYKWVDKWVDKNDKKYIDNRPPTDQKHIKKRLK